MSYGEEPSSLELDSRRAPLEMQAALLLGQLLIGQSRIEQAVQSYAAALPALHTDAGSADAFDAGMARVLSRADTLADKELRAGFVYWLACARELQPLARSLRHARWLPDPRRNVMLVLPGGSFAMDELQRAATQQKELLAEFQRLCALERGIPRTSAASFLSTQPIEAAEQPA